MVQCCCCHSNRRAKGGGGEGWVLRQERKWHKKREGVIKGIQFCCSWTKLWTHIRSQAGKNKSSSFYLIETRVSRNLTQFTSWVQTSPSVLVLPLKLYLYSCSHVLWLFRGSNLLGCHFIVHHLYFCRGRHPLG